MFHPLIRTLVKVAVASLIVGSVLAHFGNTADMLLKDSGISMERVQDLARHGIAWAGPNLLPGAMIILPVWIVVYLFRPPGHSSQD
jgi:Family of unknown function (DUF6460)